MDDLDALIDSYGAEFSGYGAEFGAAGDQYSSGYDGVVAGFQGASIAAGATGQVRVQVTQKFRAERLILDAATRAAGVQVTQISISSVDQNRGDGPVPAEVFTADATHRLRGTIVEPGVGILLTFNNGTAGAVVPAGAFFGPAQSG